MILVIVDGIPEFPFKILPVEIELPGAAQGAPRDPIHPAIIIFCRILIKKCPENINSLCFTGGMNRRTLSLHGQWRVLSQDGKYDLKVQVPGSLMETLDKLGTFGAEGLFFRENNRRAQDLARQDFAFSRTFDVDPAFLPTPTARVFLEADGLDTLATIKLNGTEVASTANMHRRYRFDVGSLLKGGTNQIEMVFANAPAYIEAKQRERSLWHTYWETPEYAMQGYNRIRKSHCSFGWDWGPIVPDIGIWRDLRLVRYDGARLRTPLTLQDHRGGTVGLRVEVPVEFWGTDLDDSPRPREEWSVSVELRDPEGALVARGVSPVAAPRCPCGGDPSVGVATFDLVVEKPRLWWPAGLGEHPLYRLTATLLRGDLGDRPPAGDRPWIGEAGDRPHREGAQTRELSLGLRTLTVRREVDQWGESFAFEVNGIPFFARGADWIPDDVYLTRPTRESTRRLIGDAAAANFNCLRVWGGGVYPSDEFYDLCDEYGLVVWQDLMFACATYDVRDPAFLSEIVAEVEDNLRRLRHHASLGLICGNNEMEVAFVDWGFPHTKEMRTEYLKQYQFIFPEIAARIAPQTFYWPASPSSGGDFENPNDPDRGDTHYWEVWHGNKDFSEYEKHYFRFMSEFGFESFPSMKTLESFTLPEDRNVFSPVMEDHQRCAGGNQKIFAYLSKYFRFPRDLSALVYLSQLSQAEAIRHGSEHWRRHRGRCMGAVYWQFNDNWPVASWSSVDYFGRWKALHYRARSFFANLLLSCPVDGERVELHLSNEGRTPERGTVSWLLVDTGGTDLDRGKFSVSADPLSSTKVFEKNFTGVDPRRCLFFYRFTGEGGTISEGAATFGPFKGLDLASPKYRVAASVDETGRTVLTVSSDQPALFVELDCPDRDLLFSDNYFHLDGKTPKTVVVERGGLSPQEAPALLRTRSLRESY